MPNRRNVDLFYRVLLLFCARNWSTDRTPQRIPRIRSNHKVSAGHGTKASGSPAYGSVFLTYLQTPFLSSLTDLHYLDLHFLQKCFPCFTIYNLVLLSGVYHSSNDTIQGFFKVFQKPQDDFSRKEQRKQRKQQKYEYIMIS